MRTSKPPTMTYSKSRCFMTYTSREAIAHEARQKKSDPFSRARRETSVSANYCGWSPEVIYSDPSVWSWHCCHDKLWATVTFFSSGVTSLAHTGPTSHATLRESPLALTTTSDVFLVGCLRISWIFHKKIEFQISNNNNLYIHKT